MPVPRSGSIPHRWIRAVPLSSLTTWRIGGLAQFFSAPAGLAELQEDLAAAQRMVLPVFAIGDGSNLLFSDAGYDGLILRLPDSLPGFQDGDPPEPGLQNGDLPDNASAEARAQLRLAAGASLTGEARRLARLGWSGLEWAEGIPGTIGGAITNNAGAHGGSIDQVLDRVQLILPDGTLEERSAAALDLAYRTSSLKHHDPTQAFIVSAVFQVKRSTTEQLLAIMKGIHRQREAKVPQGPSCGCVFRNPEGESAGKLIQRLGLAGARSGGALVSSLHANFILNAGRASAVDVLDLIEIVRRRVFDATGQRLELEIQLVGFPHEQPTTGLRS